VAKLLVEANELFEQADAALPDFAEYATLTRRARAKIAQAEALLEEAGATPSTTTTTEGLASA
jgi:D-lyxose ketol-isomerase